MMLIAPLDAAFLISETREHPMHVGALLLFEQPDEAGRRQRRLPVGGAANGIPRNRRVPESTDP